MYYNATAYGKNTNYKSIATNLIDGKKIILPTTQIINNSFLQFKPLLDKLNCVFSQPIIIGFVHQLEFFSRLFEREKRPKGQNKGNKLCDLVIFYYMIKHKLN